MPEEEKKRILVIEDEAHMAEGLKLNLSLKGHEVRIATDGLAGLNAWREWRPHLIVLDIMLPVMDGLTVLQNIRLEDERLPILILSARGKTDDRIAGFTHGVDDYLAKPFDLDEFLLRVDRLLTRVSLYEGKPGPQTALATYRFGGNSIDFTTLTATGKTGEVTLTDQEAKLLKLFIANRGKPLSRQRILEIGWGFARGSATRTVDNFVVRLRKYFEDNPKKPAFFKSRRSVGYIFDHEDE
jgi:two-component system alkaline phosphatase synthesis response regulator PhoP